MQNLIKQIVESYANQYLILERQSLLKVLIINKLMIV